MSDWSRLPEIDAAVDLLGPRMSVPDLQTSVMLLGHAGGARVRVLGIEPRKHEARYMARRLRAILNAKSVKRP